MRGKIIVRLVDLVLLLLFGFISLASLRADVELAESERIDGQVPQTNVVTVEVMADGTVRVMGQPTPREGVASAVAASGSAEAPVVVLADREAPGELLLGMSRDLSRRGHLVRVLVQYKGV